MHVCAHLVYAEAKKQLSDLWELELRMVISHGYKNGYKNGYNVMGSGDKPRMSARAASALNHLAVSPAPCNVSEAGSPIV